MSNNVSMVYRSVVDDVIKNIKTEFLSEGISNEVLMELQQLWETKLFQTESFAPLGLAEDFQQAYNIGGYNYSGIEGTDLNILQAVPSSTPSTSTPDIEPDFGKPQPFLPPAAWSAPPFTVVRASPTTTNRPVPQYDGGDDDDDDDDDGVSTGSSNTRVKTEGDDDAELGSEDDDEDENEEPDTDNIILCQFEKVTRIKNKRKCTLKAGVMHLKGRDYLFNKANGEFEW
jgi:transcription initiation factor TFIIA large subunit